ncbi:immunoglobulin domain-containing protein oig-4-like [Oratosquilla oratoria]|uniref:immunoglobulin domain-containing protein oig-4-like n=1 Tax=Oratosquilla oratoria TaxID=337810 RepID=UPI003F777AC4
MKMSTSSREAENPNTERSDNNSRSNSSHPRPSHHINITKGYSRSLRSGGRGPGVGVLTAWVLVVALLLVLPYTEARRPRGRLQGKYKGRKHFQPIPGAYLSETAKKYYNNPKGAKITKASHFRYRYVLGHKIMFLCVARGTPLPQITWFKDGVELYAHRYMQLHEWQKGNRLKSKMEIDPASQADAGIYECHANNKYAVDTRVFRTTYMAEFTP